MGKTYIFFEPKDRIFFEKVDGIYCKLVEEYYKDAVKAYSTGGSIAFFQNYENALIFPACDYNNALNCPRTICGKPEDRWLALTDDQRERVNTSLLALNLKLLAVPGINTIIVDRIYRKTFNLLLTKTKQLSFRYINSKVSYLRNMKKNIGKDAEKLVFVRAGNSEYDYYKKGMLPKTLDECTCYQ